MNCISFLNSPKQHNKYWVILFSLMEKGKRNWVCKSISDSKEKSTEFIGNEGNIYAFTI